MSPPTLHDVVADPGGASVDDLLTAHTRQLAGVIEAVGVGTAAGAADAPRSTLHAVSTGDVEAAADLDIETVGAVLSLRPDAPAAGDIVAEALEALLFGMTTGVLDVDAVAGELELDLEPREIQAMLEGRHPVTLREYAALKRVIERRSR